MTSVIPSIQAGLRIVAGDILSTPALYRSLLSNAVKEQREYGSWTPIAGLLSQTTMRQDYNEGRRRYETTWLRSFRTADTSPRLKPGDQLMFDAGTAAEEVWGLAMIESSGPGTIRYGLERIAGSIVAGGDRGAKV